jgi:hypothetical protein
MSVSARLAVLAVGASTFAFIAHAEAPSPWVYGTELLEETAEGVWGFAAAEAQGDVGLLAVRRPKRPPPSPPPPPPPPSVSGILVGVVDTGIDLDHPEFAGRIAAGGKCFGTLAACSGLAGQGDDNNGHGTHVAGIIAAAANGIGNTGVAPGAFLLPVKVLDANGSGSYAAVANGISYAASRGARVINMSLGGDSPSTTLLAPLQQAATTAVIVAAAGNGGNALAPGYPAAYATQPGVVGSMIIVGSVNGQNQISSFSQTPGNGGCVASGGVTTCFKDVFLVAPGQSILSTYTGGQYAYMSGTSMATPYVSGVAARVLQASPYLTPQQVVGILFQSATDLGAPGTDAVYGRGLVNLQAALAPLGVQSVATSGGATSSYTGTGNVGSAGVGGVLGVGLSNSSILRDVLFFDSYGRDYRTDLTAAVGPGTFSLDGLAAQTGLFRSVSFEGNGYSVSGFVADEAPNMVLEAGFSDREQTQLSDVVIKAQLSESASVMLGQSASLGGRVNSFDLAASEAYDGLFVSASALNSPYLALSEDAAFVAGSVTAGAVTFTAGHAQTQNDDRVLVEDLLLVDGDLAHLRSATNTVAAASWRFAPWGLIGVSVARTQEENSLLGTFEQGALALTADAETTSVGIGARVNVGDDWVLSGSWSRGQTDATPATDGLFSRVSAVESEAYGLALSKRGVFGDNDTIGFAVSRPLHITQGSAVITASTGVTGAREIVYSTETVDLASTTPETNYEVGYTTKLDDVTSLQISAIYQQDVGGQPSRDAVAALVGLKTAW